MEQKQTARPILSLIEEKIRRFWSRLGGAIERSIGPGSSQPVDATRLIDLVETEIEKSLRYDRERVVAPNRIELRFDYETYSSLGDMRREALSRDVSTSISEFIRNRRYSTDGELAIHIGFDAFVRKPAIHATFAPTYSLTPAPSSGNEAITSSESARRVTLRPLSGARKGQLEAVFAPGKATLGVGRSRDNQLVIDHTSVSNFHASFTLSADGGIWLSDLGSSNGTSVDRIALRENDRRQVRGGERLCFGEVEVELRLSPDRQSNS